MYLNKLYKQKNIFCRFLYHKDIFYSFIYLFNYSWPLFKAFQITTEGNVSLSRPRL